MNPDEHCPRTEALSALVDKELGEPDRLAIEAHAQGCAICAPVLAGFRQLRSTFVALPEIAPGIDLAPLVDRRIGELAAAPKPGRQRLPRRWRWWQLAPAALGGAISLSLGAQLGSALILAPQPRVQPAALQMAAFAANPPGALCTAVQACDPTGR